MAAIVCEGDVTDSLSMADVCHCTGLVSEHVEQLYVAFSIARKDKVAVLGEELGNLVSFSVTPNPSVSGLFRQVTVTVGELEV